MEPEKMAELVRPHTTVADKIRALAAAGVARADIARFLGKRYQHVRNVLEADRQRGMTAPPATSPTGLQEGGAAFERDEDERNLVESRGAGAYRLVVLPDGCVMLPKEVRAAFGVTDGGVV